MSDTGQSRTKDGVQTLDHTDQDGDHFRLLKWGDDGEGAPFTVIVTSASGRAKHVHLNWRAQHVRLNWEAVERLYAFLGEALRDRTTGIPVPGVYSATQGMQNRAETAQRVRDAERMGPHLAMTKPEPGGEVMAHGDGETDPLTLRLVAGHGPALLYVTDQGVIHRLDQDGQEPDLGMTVQDNWRGLAWRDVMLLRALIDHSTRRLFSRFWEQGR